MRPTRRAAAAQPRSAGVRPASPRRWLRCRRWPDRGGGGGPAREVRHTALADRWGTPATRAARSPVAAAGANADRGNSAARGEPPLPLPPPPPAAVGLSLGRPPPPPPGSTCRVVRQGTDAQRRGVRGVMAAVASGQEGGGRVARRERRGQDGKAGGEEGGGGVGGGVRKRCGMAPAASPRERGATVSQVGRRR